MNHKTSITALTRAIGWALHAENEEHPVFADYLAKRLLTPNGKQRSKRL